MKALKRVYTIRSIKVITGFCPVTAGITSMEGNSATVKEEDEEAQRRSDQDLDSR